MPANNCYCPVTHVIFDLDGTLMDTEKVYWKSLHEALAPYGVTYTRESQSRHMGMPAIDAARAVVKEYKLPISPEQFYAVFQANVAKFLTSCPLLPGVRDLVLHLHEHRIPFCIATSSYRDIYELKAAFHRDIILAFHHVVCGNDPEIKPGRGKPMPDIFLLAASRFNPPADPKKCLVFEDSPNGLRAGVAAGMQTVFIPADHIKKDLMKGATLVLKSMAQFKPQLFGLPAFGNCSKFEFG